MKTLLYSIFIVFISFQVNAQSQSQVPHNVQDAFKMSHPMHDFLTWTIVGGNYISNSYDQEKINYIIAYDANANIIWTQTELQGMGIPKTITDYLEKKYPAATDVKVWKTVAQNGDVSFTSVHDNEKKFFDKEGVVVQDLKK